MKLKTTQKLFAALLIALGTTGSVFAQTEQRTYVLNPKEVPPQEQGYMITGVTKDKNNDGVPETYKGCGEGDAQNVTEHTSSIHNESGSSGGWTFNNVSIMTPDCNGKGTPDFGIPTGYIQLREVNPWSTYVSDPDNEDLKFGTITSLPVTNIQEFDVMIGSALSIGSRDAVFGIEGSTDGGETWVPYTTQKLEQQGGRLYSFTANGDDPGFAELATLSTTEPVMIRIMSWIGERESDINNDRTYQLQVYGLSLTATGPAVTSSKGEIAKNVPFFDVQANSFVAHKETLRVYNMVGALVGSGKSVTVPGSGLYIVRSDSGLSKKVFLQ